jgi:hypothetical protein
MEKDRNVITYVFHVHLDGRIHWGACVLDDGHPPGFRVGKEGRRLFKFRGLTAPFQKRPHDLVVYMLPANFDGIRTREMIDFVVDFLTELSIINLRSRRNEKAINVIVDILGPTAPYKVGHQLSTVGVFRCRQLRALANSADQLLERFGL